MILYSKKEDAQNLTALLKTHYVASMEVNTNGQFCIDLYPHAMSTTAKSHRLAMNKEAVEEFLKLGFAARCYFP